MVLGFRYIQLENDGRVQTARPTPIKGVTIDTEGMTVPEMPTDAIYALYYSEEQGLYWVKTAELETESTAPTEAQLTQAKLDYLMMMQGGA